MTIVFYALIPVFSHFNLTILVTKKQHFWPDPPFWSSFWLVNMGMAKKEIFITQSIFFCQLDVIKQLFVLSISRQSLSFFGGGICFQCSFLAFFFFLLLSFFTARFVAHFIVFPLCGVLAGYLFRKRAKSSR